VPMGRSRTLEWGFESNASLGNSIEGLLTLEERLVLDHISAYNTYCFPFSVLVNCKVWLHLTLSLCNLPATTLSALSLYSHSSGKNMKFSFKYY
jgi:hypothetical protein